MQSASSSETLSPLTSKYQFSLPFALQNISPGLAALHAARVRRLHRPYTPPDALTSTHCVRCGTYLLDGMGSVRSVRNSKSLVEKGAKRAVVSFSRKMRRVCNVCKHEEDIPLDNGSALLFPKVRRRDVDSKGALDLPSDASLAAEPRRNPVKSAAESVKSGVASSRASSVSAYQTPSSVPVLPVQTQTQSPAPSSSNPNILRTKSRPKKKSGLQEMLARNRERQEQEKKAATSGGLAAFLEHL